MPDSYLIKGSTYKFQATIKKDGVAWNLTSATVLLYFRKPNGTVISKTATVTDASGGVASYTCTTSDLDTEGLWSRSWHVTDGAVVQESAPILFHVLDSP